MGMSTPRSPSLAPPADTNGWASADVAVSRVLGSVHSSFRMRSLASQLTASHTPPSMRKSPWRIARPTSSSFLPPNGALPLSIT